MPLGNPPISHAVLIFQKKKKKKSTRNHTLVLPTDQSQMNLDDQFPQFMIYLPID